MKKLVSIMAVALAVFGFSAMSSPIQAHAQNYRNSLTLWATGAPGLNLNSSSGTFGQFFNSATDPVAWSLGWSTSETANGTSVLSITTTSLVGIGTTNPTSTAKLTVEGGGIFAGLTPATTAQLALRTDTAGTTRFVIYANNAAKIGVCNSTAAVVDSYIWTATMTVSGSNAAGSACH